MKSAEFCTNNFVQAAYDNSSTTVVYNKASWCVHEYVEVYTNVMYKYTVHLLIKQLKWSYNSEFVVAN